MTQFIAYNMVTQNSLAHADTANAALDLAAEALSGDITFVEVLDCGTAGPKVWDLSLPLYRVRDANRTVFRGSGYAPTWPAVAIAA